MNHLRIVIVTCGGLDKNCPAKANALGHLVTRVV